MNKSTIQGWSDPKKCKRAVVHVNCGVVTGPAVNLLVVDVDLKMVLKNFRYIDEFGMPGT